jgi:hypothetical protein
MFIPLSFVVTLDGRFEDVAASLEEAEALAQARPATERRIDVHEGVSCIARLYWFEDQSIWVPAQLASPPAAS